MIDIRAFSTFVSGYYRVGLLSSLATIFSGYCFLGPLASLANVCRCFSLLLFLLSRLIPVLFFYFFQFFRLLSVSQVAQCVDISIAPE